MAYAGGHARDVEVQAVSPSAPAVPVHMEHAPKAQSKAASKSFLKELMSVCVAPLEVLVAIL